MFMQYAMDTVDSVDTLKQWTTAAAVIVIPYICHSTKRTHSHIH